MTTDAQIRDIVAHAYANAPAIRRMMQQADVAPESVQSADDLQKLPVTSVRRVPALQRTDPPFGGLLGIEPDALTRIFVLPGPLYRPHAPPADASAALAPFVAAGFSAADRVLNTLPYPLAPNGLLLDEGARACGGVVIPAGPVSLDRQIRLLRTLQCTAFIGTAGGLHALLDRCTKDGLAGARLPLRRALLAEAPLLPAQRAQFEAAAGLSIVWLYSPPALGTLACTRPRSDDLHVLSDVFIEIVDRGAGQRVRDGLPGEVVVTLLRPAWPLVRFGTGDMGVFMAADGGERILRLLGSAGEAVRIRGMLLHPGQIQAALSRLPEIARAQVVITQSGGHDHLRMRIELRPEAGRAHIEQGVINALQAMAHVHVDAVEVVSAGTIDAAQGLIRDERR